MAIRFCVKPIPDLREMWMSKLLLTLLAAMGNAQPRELTRGRLRCAVTIRGQGSADIVRFIELAPLVAADKALVPASIDQFSLAGHQVHPPAVHGIPHSGGGELAPTPSRNVG